MDHNLECGLKSVPKVDPKESVGVILLNNKKPTVLEYSEISADLCSKVDEQGCLVYKQANIANHFFTVEFLKKIKEFESKLTLHVAHKKIKHFDRNSGLQVQPTVNNGIKLELFIFDVFPFAERFGVLEVERREEFSALKNSEGNDSAETSRRDIMAQHVRYVEAAGGKVLDGAGGKIFEISALVSLEGEGLEALEGKSIETPKLISFPSDLVNP